MEYQQLQPDEKLQIAKDRMAALERDHFSLSLTGEQEERIKELEKQIESVGKFVKELEKDVDKAKPKGEAASDAG